MAQEKETYRSRLAKAVKNHEAIEKEISDFAAIQKLANGNKEISDKLEAMKRRYDADLQFSANKVEYLLGKAATEDKVIRQMILDSLTK